MGIDFTKFRLINPQQNRNAKVGGQNGNRQNARNVQGTSPAGGAAGVQGGQSTVAPDKMSKNGSIFGTRGQQPNGIQQNNGPQGRAGQQNMSASMRWDRLSANHGHNQTVNANHNSNTQVGTGGFHGSSAADFAPSAGSSVSGDGNMSESDIKKLKREANSKSKSMIADGKNQMDKANRGAAETQSINSQSENQRGSGLEAGKRADAIGKEVVKRQDKAKKTAQKNDKVIQKDNKAIATEQKAMDKTQKENDALMKDIEAMAGNGKNSAHSLKLAGEDSDDPSVSRGANSRATNGAEQNDGAEENEALNAKIEQYERGADKLKTHQKNLNKLNKQGKNHIKKAQKFIKAEQKYNKKQEKLTKACNTIATVTKTVGTVVKTVGQATETTGKATKTTGEVETTTGSAMEACVYTIPPGVALNTVGITTTTTGTTTETAGKGTKESGKTTQKVGNNSMTKAANTMKQINKYSQGIKSMISTGKSVAAKFTKTDKAAGKKASNYIKTTQQNKQRLKALKQGR